MLGWYVCRGGCDEVVFVLFTGGDMLVCTGVNAVIFSMMAYYKVPVEVSHNGYERGGGVSGWAVCGCSGALTLEERVWIWAS